MADFLDIEQLATLNGVLLQVVSNYTITSDDESQHDSSASNLRLLEMFLSAKQVEGCSIKTAKYYEVTIKQLFKKMPKKVLPLTLTLVTLVTLVTFLITDCELKRV